MEFLKKLFFTCCFRNKETNRDIDDIKHNEDNINNKIEEAESMMIDMDSSIHKTNISKRLQLREQQRVQEKIQEKIQLTKLDNTRVYSSRRQAMIFKEDAPLPERKKIWK